MKSKVFVIGVALGVASLLITPAAAIDYTYVGDGTSWLDSSAWDPAGVPDAGDNAQIGDGVNPIWCAADGRLSGMPASIVVKDQATVDVLADLNVITDGTSTFPTMTVESGGRIRPRGGNNGYHLDLLDGSEIITSENAIYANENMEWTLNGMVRFTAITGAENQQRFDNRIVGTGGIIFSLEDPVNDVALLKLRQDSLAGGHTYSGETIVESGEVQFVDNTDPDGDGTLGNPFATSKVTAYPGTKVRGYNLNLNPDGLLYLQGTGANAAQLTMNNGHENTVLGAVFGGTPVPAGDYTFGTDYTDYLIPRSADPGAVLHVLTTVPEPATLSVLAVGALALVRRRR
jgi:hypothetical protein